jgi:hypothetical protein
VVFETLLDSSQSDGVEFMISVDGKPLYTGKQTSTAPASHEVDVTAYQGKSILITFSVNSHIHSNNDWFYWVNPIVISKGSGSVSLG